MAGSSVVEEVLPKVTVVRAPRLWVRLSCEGVIRSLALEDFVSASNAIRGACASTGVTLEERRNEAFLGGLLLGESVPLCGLSAALLKVDWLDCVALRADGRLVGDDDDRMLTPRGSSRDGAFSGRGLVSVSSPASVAASAMIEHPKPSELTETPRRRFFVTKSLLLLLFRRRRIMWAGIEGRS